MKKSSQRGHLHDEKKNGITRQSPTYQVANTATKGRQMIILLSKSNIYNE